MTFLTLRRAVLAALLVASALPAQAPRKTQVRAIVRDSACAPATGWVARDTTYRTMTEATNAARVKRTCPAPPVTVSPPVVAPGVTILFADGFESGALTTTQNGVRWTGATYVDVVGAIARTGTRAARFKQGIPLGDGNSAELRFGGLPRLPEVFVQFYLYLPNGAESPSVGPKVTVKTPRANDKFFRLWADDYGAVPKFGASTWSGNLGTEYTFVEDNGTSWGMGQGPTPSPLVPLLVDANMGRWLQVRIRVKVSGADNASGVVQVWLDGRLLLNDTRLAAYPRGGVRNYLANGYLFGWANGGFSAGQVLYVDDVVISTGGFPG